MGFRKAVHNAQFKIVKKLAIYIRGLGADAVISFGRVW